MVTGTATYKGRYKGQDINEHARFTDTFAMRSVMQLCDTVGETSFARD